MKWQSYSDRVWAGDRSSVAEARKAWRADPTGKNLVKFAIALYSFRHIEEYALELLILRPDLVGYAKEFAGPAPHAEPRSPAATADLADVLSTHFAWMVRHSGVGTRDKLELRELARRVIGVGTGLVLDPSHHTPFLLALTAAELDLENGNVHGAVDALRRCARSAHLIKDANQRARVYRKIGLLYRKTGAWLTGFQWGIRACLVEDVPLAVRAKSAAALLGIER